MYLYVESELSEEDTHYLKMMKHGLEETKNTYSFFLSQKMPEAILWKNEIKKIEKEIIDYYISKKFRKASFLDIIRKLFNKM